MTQEGKQLLLEDLSARLPYEVKVTWDDKHPLTITPHIYCAIVSEDNIKNLPKLLLRPLSSMTKEESKEFESIWNSGFEKALDAQVSNCDDNVVRNLEIIASSKAIDWLNKKMFAYRTIDGKDMFELGLAIEALDGMYNIKEK
jgi:hypothetical protein